MCPDCRFVFRVPRDHDGQGVVCPSCRRMLRIPTAGDRPPPLVASLRVTAADERTVIPQARHHRGRRRSKKSHRAEAHEWDSTAEKVRRVLTLKVEKRQMAWMLIGGVALFAMIVTGVLIATRSKVVPPPPAMGSAARGKPDAGHPAVAERSDEAFLADAEPLAKKFLTATRVEDLLPLVRHPETTEARMRKFYPNGAVDPPGLMPFNLDTTVDRAGKAIMVRVSTRSEEKMIAYFDTKDGLRIDWESWVGWSPVTWSDFTASKPTTAMVFRVIINPSYYYNFAYSDEKKWQCYQISPAGDGAPVYGYAERESEVCAKLPAAGDNPEEQPRLLVMLALKFPENATVSNQVLIDHVVADGWVLENDPPP